jgi:hypothetical protein
MQRINGLFSVLVLILLAAAAQAQVRHELQFPDLPGYQTLKCDFHMHSVFSDGAVWPTVRVDEAWRLGLDAIALTDHIEYQPHRDDVPTNFNRSFDLAAGRAQQRNLLFPKGAEITRDTPPGHFNAIFLNDVAPLDTPEFVDAVKRANEQGAFVFWNHQEWKGPELGRWMEVHTLLYDNRLFQGMEVCNGESYYPQAHRWCLEKGLTMLGNSDIHEPDRLEKNASNEHRTLTLVFAKERKLDSLKEALFAGRTAVWFQDRLIGKREWLEPLFHQCVQIERPHLRTEKAVWFQIRNRSSMDIRLQRVGTVGPAELTLPADTVTLLTVSMPKPPVPVELSYMATGFVIEPDTGLPVVLRVPD